jgi:hypothetical protein
MAWDDRYERRYGYWRPYIMDVIYRYLDCGDLHFGFARVKCAESGHEYLLAYSCKRRPILPICGYTAREPHLPGRVRSGLYTTVGTQFAGVKTKGCPTWVKPPRGL